MSHNRRTPAYKCLYEKVKPDDFIFAIIRNPFSRLVSAYHYLKKGGTNKSDKKDRKLFLSQYYSFYDFVKNGLKDAVDGEQVHLLPQKFWISDNMGNLIVDHLGIIDDIEYSLDFALDKVGLGDHSYDLPYINSTSHKPYEDYYNKELKAIVTDIYKQDMELYNQARISYKARS